MGNCGKFITFVLHLLTRLRSMTRFFRLILIIGALCLCTARVAAQEEEYDYRKYKFYDEVDDASWFIYAVEQLTEATTPIEYHQDYMFTAIKYPLLAVTYSPRGAGYDEQRNMLDMFTVDYTTARQMSMLGIYSQSTSGLTAATHSGGTALTRHFTPYDTHRHAGHQLQGELTGRGYIGGISYRATYRPLTNGVLLKDGWSYTHYARARMGRDIYVDGVSTHSVDLAFEALYRSKRDNITLMFMLPWSERGLRQPSTEEAFTLTNNTMYNPAWGFDAGKVRNSRMATTLRPEVVAGWRRRLTAVTDLVLWGNIYFERRANSMLAWFDAMTPAPDNYHWMPSYFDDDDERRPVTEAWVADDPRYTQIAWDELRHTNRLQVDGQARYAVESRRENRLHAAFMIGGESRVRHVTLRYGIELRHSGSRNFKVMDDLLGADHITDWDYYLEDDAYYGRMLQNDLRNPNRIVHRGDRYGYDYRLTRLTARIYTTAEWAREDMSFSIGGNIGSELTQRRGYYEKELFKGRASYGRSRAIWTSPYKVAASWYKLLDIHGVGASMMLRGESPTQNDMFLQPQYNNRTVDSPHLVTTLAGEASYHLTLPRLRLVSTLYATYTTNDCHVARYYDDIAGLYTNAVISGIDRLHIGVEFIARVTWSQIFSSTFMLNGGSYRYTDNASVVVYADANNDIAATTRSAIKSHHCSAPELTAIADITLRKAGWTAAASVQYWGFRHVEPSYIRRSERILQHASSPEDRTMLQAQQRLPDACTVDLRLGKRINIGEGTSLYVQLSLGNIVGSHIIQRGYEQNRVRRTYTADYTHISPFDNRLLYAYPRTVRLTATLRF